ncbi:MAG: 50S ribosomal protein L10 [Gemmatimonadota bacterium]|nr:50S ribosomal protein L10 [Gemmatimonadota bacterium]MDH4350258.1 50S ribosomal protein L10 [Gemmatimonadota bacterium]MDH5198687.1 50S ribosomal protein L10 [Gemmatimonadota bacterium]
MKRTEKSTIVADIRARIARRPNVYLTDFTGLKVKQVTDLRRRFRQAGLEYVVLKNTLAQRALAEADITGLDDALAGPTGWVFAEDPVTAAKIIADFQKEAGSFQVKIGLVEGRPVTPEDVSRLAKLPSRTELLSQLAGALQAPLQAFLGVTNGLMYQWVGALEALRSQRSESA